MKNARYVESLIFNSEIRILVREAAKALGNIKDARAIEYLIICLEDADLGLRIEAAEAIVKFGSMAVEPLIKKLEDKNSYVRREAVKALVNIKDARAVEPLIKTLKIPIHKPPAVNPFKIISDFIR